MRTTKPFSTIWFGSEEFLKLQLDGLIKRGKMQFYCYIKHHKEEDEKKDHIHVYMEPDGQLDTHQLTELLTEYVPDNNKPVRPSKYNPSKFGDWYLYDTHNVAYLASKGQKRKYHYSRDDVIASDDDVLTEMIHTIDLSKLNTMEMIRNAAVNGIPFESLVLQGQVPIQQINQYRTAYEMIQNISWTVLSETYRNVGTIHEFTEPQNTLSQGGEGRMAFESGSDEVRQDQEDYQTTIYDFLEDADDLPF